MLATLAVPAAIAVARESASSGSGASSQRPPMDVQQFHATRQFARLRQGRIAYVERGRGPAALFLHGLPLNSFQWRGALDRLSEHRRCIAADFMGSGYSEVPEGTDQTPEAQASMLGALLDRLGEKTVDLVGSDSGGAVAQIFAARHPQRVRTLLLTNCDTIPDCPPGPLLPLIADARAGVGVEKHIIPMLADVAAARKMLGQAYTDPNTLTAEILEVYLRPFEQSPLRRKQYNEALLVLDKNVLQPVEAELRQLKSPVRIVWGTADTFFKKDSPDYLDRLFANSRGIRRVEGAQLFWPEEFPDIVAEEARKLWGV